MSLEEYVKSQLARGYSKEQLRHHLLEHGYTLQQVEAAFRPARSHGFHYFLLIVSALGLVLLMSLVYFMMQPEPQPPERSEPIETIEVEPPEQIPEIPGEQTTIPFCDDKECAEQAFSQCEPTQGEYSMYFVLNIEYEILGSRDGLCEVFGRVISAPDGDFEGKSMTCLLDSTQDLETAMQQVNNCQGSLADAIRAYQQ